MSINTSPGTVSLRYILAILAGKPSINPFTLRFAKFVVNAAKGAMSWTVAAAVCVFIDERLGYSAARQAGYPPVV